MPKLRQNQEPQILVSVRVPKEAATYKNSQGIDWRHLILLGIHAHKNNPQLVDRVRASEERISALEIRFSRFKESFHYQKIK